MFKRDLVISEVREWFIKMFKRDLVISEVRE